jgi:hypothetical protein
VTIRVLTLMGKFSVFVSEGGRSVLAIQQNNLLLKYDHVSKKD